jgi:Enoyl-(Acyl carrier protein) reductase
MTERWLVDPAFKEAFLAASPIGRAAEPEEMVGMVLHLCSDEASFTNGQVFIIDGARPRIEEHRVSLRLPMRFRPRTWMSQAASSYSLIRAASQKSGDTT